MTLAPSSQNLTLTSVSANPFGHT